MKKNQKCMKKNHKFLKINRKFLKKKHKSSQCAYAASRVGDLKVHMRKIAQMSAMSIYAVYQASYPKRCMVIHGKKKTKKHGQCCLSTVTSGHIRFKNPEAEEDY